MKNYNLLVFDWDGTLVDSEGLTIDSIQKVASNIGYPVPKKEEIRKRFGLLLEDMLHQLFPEENTPYLMKEFNKYFNEEKLATHFFENAIETLTHLKNQGFSLAVATNRARNKLDMALEIANLKNFFDITKCPEDGAPKPNPIILLDILKNLNINHKDTLMIGDTIFDMQFANNAEVDALAACYGFHNKEQLKAFNPIGFIENINELKNILTRC